MPFYPVASQITDKKQRLMEERDRKANLYRSNRNQRDLPAIPFPHFCIDATRPMGLLRIQHRYDVQRSAVHLASQTLTLHQTQTLHNVPGRCFYTGSPELTAGMTLRDEEIEIIELSMTDYTICPWLPLGIAQLVSRSQEGRSLEDVAANADWPFPLPAPVYNWPPPTLNAVESAIFIAEDAYFESCIFGNL